MSSRRDQKGHLEAPVGTKNLKKHAQDATWPQEAAKTVKKHEKTREKRPSKAKKHEKTREK